ncbi:MAG: hypothetical protein R3D43_12905 [Tepidamorphaceae bacterium]
MTIKADKIDARQGDRKKENLRVLIASAVVLIIAVAMGGIFLAA